MNYLTANTNASGKINVHPVIANARCHYGFQPDKEYALSPVEVPAGYRLVTMDDMAKLDKEKANDALFYYSSKKNAWVTPAKKDNWQVDNVYCIRKDYKERRNVSLTVTIDGAVRSVADLTAKERRELGL